jgi:hypothetical protein
MSNYVHHMSSRELQFLKLYAITLKHHFSVFVSALNMMRASELHVKCPVEAARLAQGLNNLRADFEHTLAEVIKGNKFRLKHNAPEYPTTEEITQLIHVSFFKLVEPGKQQLPSVNLGWFSGHPLEWDKVWTQTTTASAPGLHSIKSVLVNALANLFKMGYSAQFKKPQAYEEPPADDDWYDQDEYGDH